jgi:hypothetical protein
MVHESVRGELETSDQAKLINLKAVWSGAEERFACRDHGDPAGSVGKLSTGIIFE